jgi:hypothetical protein
MTIIAGGSTFRFLRSGSSGQIEKASTRVGSAAKMSFHWSGREE